MSHDLYGLAEGMDWITIQLGSREHYAIPVALYEEGRLGGCITDVWLDKTLLAALSRSLPTVSSRGNVKLPASKVTSNAWGRLAIDTRMRLLNSSTWDIILKRNEWFGEWAAKVSTQMASGIVFSYSYTALRAFRNARSRGASCILGQIDPGPLEEKVVLEATKTYRHLAPPADRAPQQYWDLWRKEVAMADKIIVNSPWSAKLLVEAGVPSEKLVEIPLVYAPAVRSDEWRVTGEESGENKLCRKRAVAKSEKAENLKVLFLGSVILRKGVGQLFDAIKVLRNEAIDFTFAGPIGVTIPDEISQMTNVSFLGPVNKAAAERLYRSADVFIFPTLSDGFGLTQLEALGQGLPVISSTHCGRVVEDRVSGLVLPEVSAETIADAVMTFARDRDFLSRLKANARVPDKYHPRHLASALIKLGC